MQADQPEQKVLYHSSDMTDLAEVLSGGEPEIPQRIGLNPENVERGLAKLVLTLIELLRQLMEQQALRRVEGGRLTDEEIERLGLTFMKLQARMEELCDLFGLEKEELNLNLGPLGDLL